MERYKGRKFMLTIAAIILASLFFSASKLTGGEWLGFMLGVLGMYKTADVSEKRVQPE